MYRGNCEVRKQIVAFAVSVVCLAGEYLYLAKVFTGNFAFGKKTTNPRLLYSPGIIFVMFLFLRFFIYSVMYLELDYSIWYYTVELYYQSGPNCLAFLFLGLLAVFVCSVFIDIFIILYYN